MKDIAAYPEIGSFVFRDLYAFFFHDSFLAKPPSQFFTDGLDAQDVETNNAH